MSNLLIIPKPNQVFPVGFANEVKIWTSQQTDIPILNERKRQLDALSRYFTDKNQKQVAEAASRCIELRIGELLGSVEERERNSDGTLTSSLASEQADIPKDDRYKFRVLAENKEEVEALIEEGITSRAAILSAIKISAIQARESESIKSTDGPYDVIVIDPPWPMQKIERDVRPNQSAFDYPTMTEDELAALNIPTADDCHVWVWTTHKFLPMALRLLDKWDMKYVCTFVWHKPGGFQPIGLPQYNCEFALYARKGTPQLIDTKALPVCFNAPRGMHSEKPEEFYEVLRRVTAGRRLDMFNRREITGFDSWGNEANG
jgi:N6-adenosine-specific RNA methylase IME4